MGNQLSRLGRAGVIAMAFVACQNANQVSQNGPGQSPEHKADPSISCLNLQGKFSPTAAIPATLKIQQTDCAHLTYSHRFDSSGHYQQMALLPAEGKTFRTVIYLVDQNGRSTSHVVGQVTGRYLSRTGVNDTLQIETLIPMSLDPKQFDRYRETLFYSDRAHLSYLRELYLPAQKNFTTIESATLIQVP